MSDTDKKKLPRYRGHSRLAKAGKGGSLTVPADMMILLAEGLLFKPELTKDGILFKIVDESKIATEDKALPAWVKKVTTTTSNTSMNVPEINTGPIPPSAVENTDDDHPDNDLSDNDTSDDAYVDAEEAGDFGPPVTDDDTPF